MRTGVGRAVRAIPRERLQRRQGQHHLLLLRLRPSRQRPPGDQGDRQARKAFDFYQGSPEGKTTVNAQLYGYTVLGHNTTAQILLRFLRNNKK